MSPAPTSDPEPSPAQADATHPAARAVRRAQQRARLIALYTGINQLFNFYPRDFWTFLKFAARWSALGGVVGILAGTASAVFLISLEWATVTRVLNPWLIGLLPIAGFLMGWTYRRFGGTAALGNNLVIDEVNVNRARIPLRMAPMILIGTVITHLFGGSAGREGTAIQMGASLADNMRRILHLEGEDRRLLLMAGIAGGFGSVFGVPAAGMIFGMEVQRMGRLRYNGLIPCLSAAYIGDIVTRAWGAPHAYYPHLPSTPIEPVLLAKIILAGIVFGLTSVLFIELTHGIKLGLSRITAYTPLYPVLGGVILLALTFLIGSTDYLGLSLPLIFSAVGEGGQVVAYAFALKLLFTAVTLGSGYLGGEVTPLFVIGATLGHSLGHVLGVEPAFLASIGLVAVFAGASNTPLACAVMGIELFGGGGALYLFAGCAVSYLASGHRGIYLTQRIDTPKGIVLEFGEDESLQALNQRRGGGWLPTLPGYGPTVGGLHARVVMSQPVVTVAESANIEQIMETALGHGVRALPVIGAGHQAVGMITDRELMAGLAAAGSRLPITFSLLRTLAAENRHKIHARLVDRSAHEIMTTTFATISPQASLVNAVRVLQSQAMRPLLVTDEQSHPLGILTRSDILRVLAFLPPETLARDPQVHVDARCGAIDLLPVRSLAHSATPAELYAALLPHPTNPAQSATPPQSSETSAHDAAVPKVLITDSAGKPIGVITYDDLLTRGAAHEQRDLLSTQLDNTPPTPPRGFSVGARMSTPVVTVSQDTLCTLAVRLLIQHRIKHLPVCDETGKALGLLDRTGLLNALYPQP